MDIPIKSEIDIYDNTISDSPGFAEITPNEQNFDKPEINIVDTKVEQTLDNINKVLYELEKNAVDKKDLSFHSRKMLLRAFQQEGCSTETLQKFSVFYTYNVNTAIEYFTKAAKDAQDYVYQECDSLSFNNITEWLKYLKAIGGPQQCNYEAAFILNAIAYKEDLPEPALMDGIDLKAIYRFLSKALMGLPQEQLDETSAKFLSNEFQNIIDEANTDDADEDVRNMKSKIEASLARSVHGKPYNLDPLNTNTEELKEYYANNINNNTE